MTPLRKIAAAIGTGAVIATPFIAFAITIDTSVPGSNTSADPTQKIGAIIANFYQFALLIGGILALGAIVWGGVKYTWAQGNPSAQSEGKEWIKAAIYGLMLLAGAYIILNTINPNLLNLNLPKVQQVSVPDNASQSSTCTPACGSSSTCQLIGTQYTCVSLTSLNCNGICGKPDPSCPGTCTTGVCTPHEGPLATVYACVTGNASSSSGCDDVLGDPHCLPGPNCQGFDACVSGCTNFPNASNCPGLQ